MLIIQKPWDTRKLPAGCTQKLSWPRCFAMVNLMNSKNLPETLKWMLFVSYLVFNGSSCTQLDRI